ncbi:DUF7167 family protein [Pseudomonas aeruginosa]
MELIKIKMYVDTGFAGCKHEDSIEIDKGYWESLSEEGKDEYLEELAQDFLGNHIDFGAYVESE